MNKLKKITLYKLKSKEDSSTENFLKKLNISEDFIKHDTFKGTISIDESSQTKIPEKISYEGELLIITEYKENNPEWLDFLKDLPKKKIQIDPITNSYPKAVLII